MVPQKIKQNLLLWSHTCPSGVCPQSTESGDWNRCLHAHVHSSVILSSQTVEAAHVCISGGTGTGNEVYPYNGMLLRLKKEGHSHTCYNMDEP